MSSNINQAQDNGWLWIHGEEDIINLELYNQMLSVDKKFYKIAIGKSEKLSPIDFFEDSCGEFLLDSWYFRAVESIVGITHGNHITCLQLMNVKINFGSLTLLLSYMPNLKILKLFFVNSNMNKTLKSFKTEELPRLTDLMLYDCGNSITQLMKYIPNGAMKSLTIKTSQYNNLASYFTKQKAITKISLFCPSFTPLPAEIFIELQLTHLILNVQSAEDMEKVITGQKMIQMLNTGNLAINGSTFEKIMDLKELNSLTINVADVAEDLLKKYQTRIEKLATFKTV